MDQNDYERRLRHCYLDLKWFSFICTSSYTLLLLNELDGILHVYILINVKHVHLMIRKWIVCDIRHQIFKFNGLGINQRLNFIFQGEIHLYGMLFHPRVINTNLVSIVLLKLGINRYNRDGCEVDTSLSLSYN